MNMGIDLQYDAEYDIQYFVPFESPAGPSFTIPSQRRFRDKTTHSQRVCVCHWSNVKALQATRAKRRKGEIVLAADSQNCPIYTPRIWRIRRHQLALVGVWSIWVSSDSYKCTAV